MSRPRHLGYVYQSLDSLLELDERSVIGDRDHLSPHLLSEGVAFLDPFPWIRRQLLEAEGHSPVLSVHPQYDNLNLVALLDDLAGVLDAPGPGHVGDVNQTIDSVLDLDEGAEACETPQPKDSPRRLRKRRRSG